MNKISMQALHTAFHLKQAQTALRMVQANIIYGLGDEGSNRYAGQIVGLMNELNTDLAKLDNIKLTTGNKS